MYKLTNITEIIAQIIKLYFSKKITAGIVFHFFEYLIINDTGINNAINKLPSLESHKINVNIATIT